MMLEADEVASRLLDAYAEGPVAAAELQAGLAADPIEIRHVPGLPDDGLQDGPEWGSRLVASVKTIADTVPDFQHDAELVAVEGEEIRLLHSLKGTLDDGTRLDRRLHQTLTVSKGKITKGVSQSDDPDSVIGFATKALGRDPHPQH